MRLLEKLLPHVSIVLAGMLIVFVALDRTNPSMGYSTNEVARVLLIALAVTSVINAIALIARQRRE